MTRSRHRFRVDASPFVPTAALLVILDGSNSSDTEDEDTGVEPTCTNWQNRTRPYFHGRYMAAIWPRYGRQMAANFSRASRVGGGYNNLLNM